MKLTLTGHEDRYAVEQLQLALFPEGTEGEAESKLTRKDGTITAETVITLAGNTTRDCRSMAERDETVRLRRQLLQQSYYHAALPLLPEEPAWGALAGVRPTKITTRHLLEGGTPQSADTLMKDVYYVTAPRRQLAVDCSMSTVEAVGRLEKQDISLYVGIPFCPTRCSYCSFVSRTIGRKTELMEPYLEALIREVRHTGALCRKYGRTVRTLYIGGGTPTTLTAAQMRRLLGAIREAFDLSRCIEYTVEAGRPNTLDDEKLRVIREGGADRISINPQSMEAHVLKAVGRPHSPEDILRVYAMAKQYGFTVNMDLIAGLPQDSEEGFRRSLEAVAALEPANITVHTLALKKGADLFEKRVTLPSYEEVSRMVDYANRRLRSLSYKPYYLYRQKYMSGSFENVGWSREGTDCLYNIYMMEESHTILSLGGGGMTKVNLPNGRLERFHNPKFPEQYIEMIEDVLRQKEELFSLLSRES